MHIELDADESVKIAGRSRPENGVDIIHSTITGNDMLTIHVEFTNGETSLGEGQFTMSLHDIVRIYQGRK